MAARRSTKPLSPARARPPATVDDFFAQLSHPLKGALDALRKTILGASNEIGQAVKWNAPSFFVGSDQFFATANIHGRGKKDETVLLVLHRGVKAKKGRVAIDDPDGLLEWLSPDRAAVRFQSVREVRKKAPALQAVIRSWIRQLET